MRVLTMGFARHLLILLSLFAATDAIAALTITPITWNTAGLDSNSPLTGPQNFPVGARVCSDVATVNVAVDFIWTSVNANVNLRPGSLDPITLPAIAAAGCADAYFEVQVTAVVAAYDTTRQYVITASDGSGTVSTPLGREIFVERLISQSRNSISNMFFGPNDGNLTPVGPGGAMNLVVGSTYVIRITGSTATQGYEQFAAFVNFANTIFQVLAVQSTYSANTAPLARVPNPNNKLYADACLWENDLNSPNYRSCLASGKTGGNFTTDYTVRIVGGGGTSETLNTLIYDLSGSSFHYNADFSSGARIANIINPASSTISKSFTPSTIAVNGISTLSVVITNSNAFSVSGYSFIDNLPANVVLAPLVGATSSGCGTPTFTPGLAPGASAINASTITVGANSTCTISVPVTSALINSYNNTIPAGNFLLAGNSTGSGSNTANLTVQATVGSPPTGCAVGTVIAGSDFSSGGTAAAPLPSVNTLGNATALAGSGLVPTLGSGIWSSDNINTGVLSTGNNEFFQFRVDTTGLNSVTVNFSAERTAQGVQNVDLFVGTTATPPGSGPVATYAVTTTMLAKGPTVVSSGINPSGFTFFRLYSYNSGLNNNGHEIRLDNVAFSVCQPPSLSKSFTPNIVGANQTSVLSFSVVNSNGNIVNGVNFNDTLPTGILVAASPGVTTSGCGAGSVTAVAGSSSISLSGGVIAANGTCTVNGNVGTTTAGSRTIVSGAVSSTEGGTNSGSSGFGTASLVTILPPVLSKQFAPNPVFTGAPSTLSFTINNPNPSSALSSLAFTDTFPLAPGAMVVATPSGQTTTCGGIWTTTAGSGSVNLTGGTLAGGSSCTVTVNVTAPTPGTYNNVSGNVSHLVGGVTVNGNSASASVVVENPAPLISLLKQVGTTATGPWFSTLAVAVGTPIFYRFTVENLGDVALARPAAGFVNDPDVNTAACVWSNPLPVAVAANENHINTCVVADGNAVAPGFVNTATASSTTVGTPNDVDSSIYGTAGLTLAKSASPSTYSAAGQLISYSLLVTNAGAATLSGPVTVSDPLTLNEACPALTTVGDNDNFFDPGEQILCTASYTTTLADVGNPSVINTASASAGGFSSPNDSATVTQVNIDAVNDNFNAFAIDGVSGGATPSVYGNDTRNGAPFPPNAVIPSITNPGGLTGVSINGDGTLSVPPGSAAGTYTVTYRICLVSNPATCDTATASVTVLAVAAIDAVNNDFSGSPISPVTGGTTTSIYGNDRLNGATFTPPQVTSTLINNGGLTGLVLNANGTLTVPPGATPGIYRAIYQICNASAPTVCDRAEVVLLVAGLDAVNDDFTNAGINSVAGGQTPSVYSNDTLGGAPFAPTAVTPSITNAGGLTGVSINPNGTLQVPPGTPAGTYLVTYRICLVANPAVCDSAVATVVVELNPAIDALNDNFAGTPFNSATGGNTPSVFVNDTLLGVAFSPPQVTASIVNDGGLAGISINPNGTLSVPPGTPFGTYFVTYEICSVASPANCDQAIAIIVVSVLDAVDDNFSLSPINGTTGGATPTLYTNDTNNGGAFAPASVTPSITNLGGLPGATTINAGGQVVLPAGTPPGSYTLGYRICLVANPTVCDIANAIIVVTAGAPPQLNVTKTVSPDPIQVGNPATYTITVNNTGGTTVGNVNMTDQLRTDVTLTSFSGANWTCAGTSLVTCSFNGVLNNGDSSQLQLTVAVGASALSGNNTARASGGGDSGCPAPPAVALSRCSGSVLTGTVPVTLSDVEVLIDGTDLVVNFGTASEVGTLGFRVLTESSGLAARQALSPEVVIANGSTLVPQRYSVRGPKGGASAIWIEELTIDGKLEHYGPFALGSRSGERQISVATDWASIRAEQSSFRVGQAQAQRGRATGASLQAEVKVDIGGWVRVRHEDLLAQGIDWSGSDPAHVRISRGTAATAMRYIGPPAFGSGSQLYFLGEAVAGSLYTRSAVYRIEVTSDGGLSMPTVHANPGLLPLATSSVERIEHAPNREYSFSSPTNDPWYALRAVRVNAPLASVSETFQVPDKVSPAAAERIEVDLWGGLDFPQAPDHSVRLALNGTEIATRRFDGLNRALVAVDLPAGVLLSGNNSLTLELIGDTGIYADIVHLEAIRVFYTRRLAAINDRLTFSASASLPSVGGSGNDSIFAHNFNDEGSAACVANESGCVGYRIERLSRPDMVVLRARSGSIEQLTGAAVRASGSSFELSFATRSLAGDRYWIEPAAGVATAPLQAAAALIDPLAGAPATYLIVAHPSFIAGLAPLVAARRAEGFSVRVIDVEDLYRFYSAGSIDPQAIKLALAEAEARLGTRYVLLVGGDTSDYFNYAGGNSQSFLPTLYRPTGSVVRYAPADGAFADIDADGLADLSIGRFPVRTLAELDAVITKTLAYAQANHARKSLRLTPRNQGTLSFEGQLSTVSALLGSNWTQSSISLQNYASGAVGVAQARADLVAAVNSGQSLLSFFGHSSPSNWTQESLVTAPLVYAGMFSNGSVPTAVWQLGCWGAYFVDPQYNTIAHALMLQGNGGAAAVFGASALTEISSDVTWMNVLTPLLKTQRLGDAIRLSQRLLHEQGAEYNDVSVGGTLLGDPALRLRQ